MVRAEQSGRTTGTPGEELAEIHFSGSDFTVPDPTASISSLPV